STSTHSSADPAHTAPRKPGPLACDYPTRWTRVAAGHEPGIFRLYDWGRRRVRRAACARAGTDRILAQAVFLDPDCGRAVRRRRAVALEKRAGLDADNGRAARGICDRDRLDGWHPVADGV